jgi:hypothetical protein
MDTIPLVYKPKKLIPGHKIEEGLTGLWAAVPGKKFKGHKFTIKYTYFNDREHTFTEIIKDVKDWNKAARFRKFMDHWGRGAYTLGYFQMCEEL